MIDLNDTAELGRVEWMRFLFADRNRFHEKKRRKGEWMNDQSRSMIDSKEKRETKKKRIDRKDYLRSSHGRSQERSAQCPSRSASVKSEMAA